MTFKTARPVIGDGPLKKSDNRPGSLDQTNIPDTAKPQAPLLADTAGESDYAFFAKRPDVHIRTRLPFPNEYPVCVLAPGRAAYVQILIDRDAAGAPKRRARRRLRFATGGTA